MTSDSPGVRRLCVCAGPGQPSLLDCACQVAGFGLYTEHLPADAIDLGFASPGVDEAELVTDLIPALQAAAARRGEFPGAEQGPALAAFHVGITRVEGDDLRGAAVERVRDLYRRVRLAAAGAEDAGEVLFVGISAGLFDDIRADCGFGDGWRPLPGAVDWFRGYPVGAAVPPAVS